MLDIPYAFHSAQVDPIISELEKTAGDVSYHAPTIPVLSPLKASIVREKGVFGPHYISQHCRQTVNILRAVRVAQEQGVFQGKMMVLEIGPHPVVSTMIKAAVPQVGTLPSLRRKMDAWELVSQTISTMYIGGADISWCEFHRDSKSPQKVLRLPAYNWDLKDYWMQYVHDWSLRKGDPPLVQSATSEQGAAPASTVSRPQSTTIHRFIEETLDDSQGRITTESDISRPDLNPMVQGHKVNGVPLCTPSVYAEIALSLGEYLRNCYWHALKDHGVVVSDMVIEKALIAAPRGPQLLRTMVEMDPNAKTAKCRFATVETSGKQKGEHVHCMIRLRDPAESLHIQRQVSSIRARIVNLQQGLKTGKTYKFNKPMIYKMVGTLAQFDPKYRALEEIVLDSTDMEASSVVNFDSIKEEGVFHTNPAYIDALSQSAGFVMNANDRSNLEVEVFVNHGWSAFHLFEKFSPLKSYQTHVAMVEHSGKIWTGDILVLDGNKIVASFEGIALQGVARRLLHCILSTESVEQSATKESKGGMTAGKPPVTTTQPVVGQKPSSKKSEPLNSSVAEPRKSPQAAAEVFPQSVPVAALATAPKSMNEDKPATQEHADVHQGFSVLIMRALIIISEESGIASEELTDITVLADVGIDSPLSLMIASRFKDELALDFEASMFHDLDTIKDLKALLARSHGDYQTISAIDTGAMSISEDRENLEMVPIDSRTTSQPVDQKLISTPSGEGDAGEAACHGNGLFAKIVKIISEETGIAYSEIVDDTDFADAGIDSLLSLVISGRLRDEVNLDINIDGALFHEYPTVRDLKAHLAPTDEEESEKNLVISSSASDDSLGQERENEIFKGESDTSECPTDDDFLQISKPSAYYRRATSIILQGRPWTSSKTLFLFPDGAGSAISYANLPKIHSGLAVVGLNCPYVRHPQEMTCSLDELMKSYLDEVRRRQAKGPYNLGGWSAGGILAYFAAQTLIQGGEEVENLVLIDSPVPKGLDRLPQRFYDHCKSIGLFGKAMPGSSPGPPPHLFAHFDATIEVLHHYYAEPLPSGHLRKATIVWATESVMHGVKFPKPPPELEDTEGMKFLTEQRIDFTADGWEKLFPGTEVNVKRVANAHHFSMMQEPHAERTSEIMRSAIGQ